LLGSTTERKGEIILLEQGGLLSRKVCGKPAGKTKGGQKGKGKTMDAEKVIRWGGEV